MRIKTNVPTPSETAAANKTPSETIVHEHGASRVTIETAYDGATGQTRVVRATAAARIQAPNTMEQAYVKAAALAVKTANSPTVRKAALENMAKIADTQPHLVREAMRFEFARPKRSIAEYEAQLARTMGQDKARAFVDQATAIADTLEAAGKPRLAIVSATFAGGGVAEMFRTQAHILQQLGITIEWQKTWTYNEEYGETCRKAFDGFQGGPTVLTDEQRSHWREHNQLLGRLYQGLATDPEVGAIFLEDHHAIDMIPMIKDINPQKRIVWRSHVDMSGVLQGKPAGTYLWERALLPNLTHLGENDIALFQPGSVPPSVKSLACKSFVAPPGIDPLAPKNEPVRWGDAVTTLQKIAPGIDVNKPHIIAGGRMVPWKGLLPMLRAFVAIADEFPDANFFLFAAVGLDDWRKVKYNDQLQALLGWLKANRPDIDERIAQAMNKNAELSSIYKLAAHHHMPCCLPSLAEGYNLMASEALCQGALPSAARVGGLTRFKDMPAMPEYGFDIADIVAKIDDPTHMYTIKDGELIASPIAQQIEAVFEAGLRNTLSARRDDPTYRARYERAAKDALVSETETSLPCMSRDYLAMAAATSADLAKASTGPAPLGAAPMSRIAAVHPSAT